MRRRAWKSALHPNRHSLCGGLAVGRATRSHRSCCLQGIPSHPHVRHVIEGRATLARRESRRRLNYIHNECEIAKSLVDGRLVPECRHLNWNPVSWMVWENRRCHRRFPVLIASTPI